MSTISHKQINTLVEKFLRNPNEFESYINAQINTLEKINLLKNTQYDETIDNYTYFKCFSKSVSFNFNFVTLYEEYRKELIDKLPKEKIINIKTNVFYLDEVKRFYENMDNFCKGNRNIEIPKYFSRMICSLYVNEKISESLSLDKVYTIAEIINLCKDNKINLIDNHVESENIDIKEIIDGINNGTLVLNKAILNELDFDDKFIDDFNACRSELDRDVWYKLYETFFHYIRMNKICFTDTTDSNVINLYDDFNEIVNHLTDIMNEIKKNYRKKHKELPNLYQKVICLATDKINVEKEKYLLPQDIKNIELNKVKKIGEIV